MAQIRPYRYVTVRNQCYTRDDSIFTRYYNGLNSKKLNYLKTGVGERKKSDKIETSGRKYYILPSVENEERAVKQ
jgi:hypothetical protein